MCVWKAGGSGPSSCGPFRALWTPTSGFGGLEQNSDQLGDVEVGGVVQRVHVGPAAPQAHVGPQREQLRAETQRGGGVT